MSRAQGIRGFRATQTLTTRVPRHGSLKFGTHGLRGGSVRCDGEPPRIALFEFVHQP